MDRLARTAAARRQQLRDTIAAVWEERSPSPVFLDPVVHEPAVAGETREEIGGLVGFVAGHHHSFARRELIRLDQLLCNVRAVQGGCDTEINRVASLWAEVTDELFAHVRHEEHLLFPVVIGLLGAIAPPAVPPDELMEMVEEIEIEDLGIEVLLSNLVDATDDVVVTSATADDWAEFRGGIIRLEADTRQHLCLERTFLFPAVVELIDALS